MTARSIFEETVLVEALAQPAATRRAFVASRCGSDDDSANRLMSLLQGYQENSSFLETPAPAAALQSVGRVFSEMPPEPKPGDRINRYHLLKRIGEGGFGIVYLAEQEQPVRRRVALKVIRLGLDTREFIARFEAERQTLALMDHPHIARVFDAGATDSGRPYLVMELIAGSPITAYCDEHALPLVARLQLFLQVCSAIQHAHQKGVIHRDLKPSNILVELNEPSESGCPKVIDFGVAKATHDRLTDKTVFTRFQALIGTPAYTSPEQMDLSGLDVDTRSDIYSLGVLLYELVTGHQPFDRAILEHASLEEMRHIIREVDPPRPSLRVGALDVKELGRIAHYRALDPEKLAPTLRSDLDWIIMRCLEKDRTRRYETANALAMDLRRYLENEPVVARPPSRAYKLGKFVRRNRTWVIAGTMIAAALVTGLAMASAGFARARIQQQAAETARREAEDLVSFMVKDLKPELQRVGRSPLTAQVAEKAVRYFSKLPPDPNHASTERNRAIALEALAYVRAFSGNAPLATTLWHESLEARRRAAAGAPRDPLLAGELALTEFVEVAHTWPLVMSEAPGPGSPEIDLRLGAIVDRARKICQDHLADPDVARIFARVLVCRSRYLFQSSTRPAEGLRVGQEAERLYHDLLARNPGDTSLVIEFVRLLGTISATVSFWSESGLSSVAVAEEALAFAEAELKKNPGNVELRETAAGAAMEVSYRLTGSDAVKAAAAWAGTRERWEALVQIDPLNVFYQHRFAWAHQMEGYFLLQAGRLAEGRQAMARFISLLSPIANSPSDFLELRGQNFRLGAIAAEIGDEAGVQKHLNEGREWHRKYLASLGPELARQPSVRAIYLDDLCNLLGSRADWPELERQSRLFGEAAGEARRLAPHDPIALLSSIDANYWQARALIRLGFGPKALPLLEAMVRDCEEMAGLHLYEMEVENASLQAGNLMAEALIAKGDLTQARALLEKSLPKWEKLGAAAPTLCSNIHWTDCAVLLATTFDVTEPREAQRRQALLERASAQINKRKTGDPVLREESELLLKIKMLQALERDSDRKTMSEKLRGETANLR